MCKYRKLRIAWSVGSALAILLFLSLWVRSYSVCDYVAGPFSTTRSFGIASRMGRLSFVISPNIFPGWWADTISLNLYTHREYKRIIGIGFYNVNDELGWRVPFAFLIMLSAMLGIAPWIRRQFSLRTLLITTTLVAVVLGLTVWLK